MASLTGRTLGGYTIQEELGRGAMGVVFKAKQLSMDRIVAIKFLPNRLAKDEKIVARFMREARAAGQLSHPNIVSVHDVGIVEGLHYLAMEFVDGNSVQKRMSERGPYSEKETIDIAVQVAEALKFAHSRGILHRDIKPDNFLTDTVGRVRLADLGLARFTAESEAKEAELTQAGATMGTPHYMSPEQCRGSAVDHRSDLYSLGAAMYVMSTGQTPFTANSAAAILVKVLTEAPRPMREMGPNLSAGFVAIVEKLMAKDPERRFAGAQDLVEALTLCRTGKYKPVAPRPAPGAPAAPKSKFSLMLYGAGSAFAALIVLGIMAQRANKNAQGAPAPDGAKASEAALPATTAPREIQTVAVAPETPSAAPVVPQVPQDVKQAPSQSAPDDDEAKRELLHKREFEAQMDGMREIERRDPAAFIARLEELKKTGRPHLARNIQWRIDKVRAEHQKYLADWAELQRKTESASAKGHKPAALIDLLQFAKRHEDMPEAATARKKALALAGDIERDALADAGAGRFDDAKFAVTIVIPHLEPVAPEVAARLKKQLEQIEVQRVAATAQGDADAEALKGLVQSAAARAREPDAAGKRFRFKEAAGLLREGAGKLKSPAASGEAAALADLYSRAADILERLKTGVNDPKQTVVLPKFNNLANVRITGWTETGLQYLSTELGKQAVTWKSATGEHLLQIAEALKIGAGSSGGELFDGAALAFACGDLAAMEPKLRGAAEADPAIKPIAEAALRSRPQQQPAEAGDKEAAAQKLFTDALAAFDKNDRDQVNKHANALSMLYAETTFVKNRIQDIRNLQLGIPPGKTERKDGGQEAAVKPPPPAEPSSATEELKKLGWTEVTGEWTYDAKAKAYRVKDGGTLTGPNSDQVQVIFQLAGENSSVRAVLRDSDDIPWFAQRMNASTGYGSMIRLDGITNYIPKYPPRIGEKFKSNHDFGFPVKQDALKTAMAGKHTLRVTAFDKGLEVTIDGRSAQFLEKLRPTGATKIVLEGAVQIESATFKK